MKNLLCSMTDDEIDVELSKIYEFFYAHSVESKAKMRDCFRVGYILGKNDGLFEGGIV